jgi:adenosylmethionine-8-amino-7-oxononanoate aminotransferase
MQLNFLKHGMNSSLQQRDKEFIWHPFTSLENNLPAIPVLSAKGVYLFTEDGKKIIDAVSSWWVNIHGHGHPVLAKAVYDQALKMEHVIFAGFTHAPAIALAERLIGILPGGQKKIFFSDNGSTAVEVGIKMALQYWFNQGIEKKKIIALQGAYHGDTFGAMSVGDRNTFTQAFSSYLFHVDFIEFPQPTNEDLVLEQFDLLSNQCDVAAFIYEPLLQGSSGMRTYAPGILERLLKKAKEKEIICIADEVLTGFGRTGKLFASEFMDTYPDIIALSKGLTGGTMPMGVTSCNQKIVTAFLSSEKDKTFYHGHSYTANPLGCAAAIASLDLLLTKTCLGNIARIEENHRKFMLSIPENSKIANRRPIFLF